MPQTIQTVAVIGCGPSGIAAVKSFIDAGFRVQGFELAQGVGGNWRFNDPTGHSSVFETTHIISSKYTSQFEDFPFPADYPDYPSHVQLKNYFEAYAAHFGLTPHIRFNTRVLHCEPLDDTPDSRWRVTSAPRDGGVQAVEEFDALVVSNGHHHKPRMPSYPGNFSGQLIHSHDFKTAAPFKGQRVLVIGGGNSACDCAVETSRVAAQVDISWRRGYWLVPKFLLGQPIDKLAGSGGLMPRKLQAKLFGWLLNRLQGTNAAAGFAPPDHAIGETHPTVNSELYYFARHGKVKPRPDIERFTGEDGGKQVKFKDGSVASFDSIIACTGYHITHPFFDKTVVDFEQGPTPLYLKMFGARWQSLYFVGLFQPLGCIWPGAELQSKLAAKHLNGQWQPSRPIADLIAQELAHPDLHQLNSPRHTITVDDPAFRRRLRVELERELGRQGQSVA